MALLAYGGTDTDGAELAPVDMITGPGNIYVTAAKRICRSQVGIDAEAVATEIAILADHTASAVHVAADMISQAEHDVMAASVLVTDSVALADATDAELITQLQTTVHRERVTEALSGKQSATKAWKNCIGSWLFNRLANPLRLMDLQVGREGMMIGRRNRGWPCVKPVGKPADIMVRSFQAVEWDRGWDTVSSSIKILG